MKNNIVYQTDQLADYFSKNRVRWNQFYKSEQVIIEKLSIKPSASILDIGCGCGGLGLALHERYGVKYYTGVEINASATDVGRSLNPYAKFLCGDILNLTKAELQDKYYDIVFSLSCVDWNIQFLDMLTVAWSHVSPGGYLVATFRLTTGEGSKGFENSYQYINFNGVLDGEKASYVVLNASDLIQQLKLLNPSDINAYGYWGKPSETAVTPYKQLCFAAFSIQKRNVSEDQPTSYELQLPVEIINSLNNY